jgi:hypothetical protein
LKPIKALNEPTPSHSHSWVVEKCTKIIGNLKKVEGLTMQIEGHKMMFWNGLSLTKFMGMSNGFDD